LCVKYNSTTVKKLAFQNFFLKKTRFRVCELVSKLIRTVSLDQIYYFHMSGIDFYFSNSFATFPNYFESFKRPEFTWSYKIKLDLIFENFWIFLCWSFFGFFPAGLNRFIIKLLFAGHTDSFLTLFRLKFCMIYCLNPTQQHLVYVFQFRYFCPTIFQLRLKQFQ